MFYSHLSLSSNLKRLVFILSASRRCGDAVRSLKRLDLLPFCPVFNIVPQDGWMSSPPHPPSPHPPPPPHPLYKFSKIYFSREEKGGNEVCCQKLINMLRENFSRILGNLEEWFSSRMRNTIGNNEFDFFKKMKNPDTLMQNCYPRHIY